MATKKKLRKMMEAVVKEMPIVTNLTIEKHYVKGEELLEQGHRPEEGFEAGKTYRQAMPVIIAANHKRRMKRAFAKGGQAGVTEYIKSITKTVMNDGTQKS